MKKGVETGTPLVAAAFASGGGTNVQALLDYQDKLCPWRLSLVVTDRENAGVLERADVAGILQPSFLSKRVPPQMSHKTCSQC